MMAIGQHPALRQAGGVVLVHAMARTSRSFRKMQVTLEAEGFSTLNLSYRSRRKPLEALVEEIRPEIREFCAAVKGPVHFVGHSMGGLLVRIFLAQHPPEQLGRVVLLGTPNGGSEIADRLQDLRIYRAFFGPAGQQLTTAATGMIPALRTAPAYPVGIIAGNRTVDPLSSALLPQPNDGRVSVRSAMLEGMADHIVLATSHPWLVRHPAAIAQTVAFLREGKFTAGTTVTALPRADAATASARRPQRWFRR
jgi:pimeloyl-ACP methyl ester carboxylesterase